MKQIPSPWQQCYHTCQNCRFGSNCTAFSDSVASDFTRHCLNLKVTELQDTTLWISDGGKGLALILRHTISNEALFLDSSLLFSAFPPFLMSLFCFPQFIFSFFFLGPHPLLFPLIPLILFNRVGPLLCLPPRLPSSSLVSTPLCFKRLLLGAASWTQSLFYGVVVSHSWRSAWRN